MVFGDFYMFCLVVVVFLILAYSWFLFCLLVVPCFVFFLIIFRDFEIIYTP